MKADREQAAGGQTTEPGPPGEEVTETGGTTDEGTPVVTPSPKPNRFHGSVNLDPIRLGRDASRVAEEVVQHLSSVIGSNVEITLEIQAELPDGASDKLVRDVTENCRTLRFDTYGFEES